MKPTSLLIFFLLGFLKSIYGQELDRCWPLGAEDGPILTQQTNLVFIGNSVVIDTVYREIQFSGTCSSISDSLGNMKFFTNGCVIGNSLNDTMMNGGGLSPGACPSDCSLYGSIVVQGTLILPQPGHPSKFDLFHEACGNNVPGLSPIYIYKSVIDMALDSGRGSVISNNNILIADTICAGSLTAVKHANGIDWWIVAHEKYGDRFVKFLLDSSGITGPFFQSIGIVYDDDGHGTSKFSPDGNWYASSTQFGGIDLFKFNRCNGELSDRKYIDLPDSIWVNPVEFSPNSKILYSVWTTSISQFDLTSANVEASRQIVAINDGFIDIDGFSHTDFCFPQLAPNGKIYIGTFSGTTYMHIIDQPDSLGIACNVIQHGLHFPVAGNIQVPNFPNYRLGPVDSLYCDSLNSVSSFEINGEKIFIFPNPAHDVLTISFTNEKPVAINIYNTLGQKFNNNSNLLKDENTHLDVSNLQSGMYYLEVIFNKGKQVKIFVKD